MTSNHIILYRNLLTSCQIRIRWHLAIPYRTYFLTIRFSDLNKNIKGQINHRRGSIKMMQGWCSLAYPNISRMIRADSPMYLSTIADATTSAQAFKKMTIQLIQKTNLTTSMTRKLSHLSLLCNQTWTCLPLFKKKNLGLSFWLYSTHQSSISHHFFWATLMKDAVMLCAMALANSVFPVPGGP